MKKYLLTCLSVLALTFLLSNQVFATSGSSTFNYGGTIILSTGASSYTSSIDISGVSFDFCFESGVETGVESPKPFTKPYIGPGPSSYLSPSRSNRFEYAIREKEIIIQQ